LPRSSCKHPARPDDHNCAPRSGCELDATAATSLVDVLSRLTALRSVSIRRAQPHAHCHRSRTGLGLVEGGIGRCLLTEPLRESCPLGAAERGRERGRAGAGATGDPSARGPQPESEARRGRRIRRGVCAAGADGADGARHQVSLVREGGAKGWAKGS
jgi:hypothetical protein